MPLFLAVKSYLWVILTLQMIWLVQIDCSLLPPLWDQAPDSITDYPVITKGGDKVISINPWNYTQRLGLYKCLLNATDPYFQRIQLHGKRNILWGLAVQLGWQESTGRLRDSTNLTKCGLPGMQ